MGIVAGLVGPSVLDAPHPYIFLLVWGTRKSGGRRGEMTPVHKQCVEASAAVLFRLSAVQQQDLLCRPAFGWLQAFSTKAGGNCVPEKTGDNDNVAVLPLEQ
jgi:hypothetical protein